MREPVLSGQITNEGVLSVIQEIERRRTTGVLEFEHQEVRGRVDLIAGQIALEQREMPDGRDPVEALLELRSGEYRLFQCLPPLPVSQGDSLTRTGSLSVHVPADLMNYCEHAGMTGTLAFENAGRRAEVVYDSGELVAIRVDGTDEEDLHEVFGWEEGSFQIQAQTIPPPVEPAAPSSPELVEDAVAEEANAAAPKRSDETAQHFLASVEVALTRIVEEREKRRSPTRTSPSRPPAPKARTAEAPSEVQTGERKRPPTVRVIYLGARQREKPSEEGLRHVRQDITAEMALPEASPERKSRGRAAEVQGASATAGESTAGDGRPRPGGGGGGSGRGEEAPKPTLAGTLTWVLVVFVLLVAALGMLAQLPAIE